MVGSTSDKGVEWDPSSCVGEQEVNGVEPIFKDCRVCTYKCTNMCLIEDMH